MSDINEGHHPQDPAEGPDFDEEPTSPQDARANDTEAQAQNEERELNDGDEVTKPSGEEPPD